MEKAFRFFKLNNGVKIPSVGLGTWRAGSGIVGKAITDAITIGETLKKLFEDGLVKRDDLWITSKLWYTDNAPESVPLAINRTLDELQLDYVNLFLMHWPISMKRSVKFKPENLMKIDIPSTWRAMETLCDDGKAQAIGVTNFSSKKLGDLLEIARVPPAVNQVECHPGWQQPQLHKFCKSTGVHLSTTLPFGSGRNPGQDMLKNPILNLVAEELSKTPAQVCLRWGLQMGHSVLPKSNNEKTIKDNFDVFDWCIPEDLLARFSEIEQVRQIKGDTFVHYKYGSYKTVEELWDGEI